MRLFCFLLLCLIHGQLCKKKKKKVRKEKERIHDLYHMSYVFLGALAQLRLDRGLDLLEPHTDWRRIRPLGDWNQFEHFCLKTQLENMDVAVKAVAYTECQPHFAACFSYSRMYGLV